MNFNVLSNFDFAKIRQSSNVSKCRQIWTAISPLFAKKKMHYFEKLLPEIYLYPLFTAKRCPRCSFASSASSTSWRSSTPSSCTHILQDGQALPAHRRRSGSTIEGVTAERRSTSHTIMPQKKECGFFGRLFRKCAADVCEISTMFLRRLVFYFYLKQFKCSCT